MNPNPSGFHLFLSYARADNRAPVNQAGEGWVEAFKGELERRHAAYSGRELRVFFDAQDIDIGVDWRRRLGEGLRQSRLFLAFLSPNYLISDNCQWEWDEYLRREHSAARGDDGITPVYFVMPGDLRLKDQQSIADWLAATESKYPWFQARSFKPAAERIARRLAEDLTGRRNKSTHLELQPWFEHGPEVLRELDAAARSQDMKRTPRDPAADLRTLAERLEGLDRHISRRLDRLALADLAPGNVGRSHEHFVGRHGELRRLRDILLTGGAQSGGRGMGGRGIIAATFAPGGLGKTALARQYAHAYAEWYAAGGTWEVGCEGLTQLGMAVQKLAESERFRELALRDRSRAPASAADYLTPPLSLSEAQRADPALALEAVLAYLKRVTLARREVLVEELTRKVQAGEAERHSRAEDPPELKQPRALLLLDNVDQTQLLSASQLGLLPAEEWLEIIVTTRLDPRAFGGGDKAFAHLEVGVLPDADALQLLADFQPDHAFASPDEEQAAVQIVHALGGWTLALEILAALMGHHAHAGHRSPAQALYEDLAQHGLAWVDTLADAPGVEGQLRHSDEAHRNRVGTLISWSIARLSAPARTALEYASLLMPDQIPLSWLRDLTAGRHPEINDGALSNPHSWQAVWGELRGLRLLHPAGEARTDARGVETVPERVRIHRLVAEHVRGAGLPQHFVEVDQFLGALGRAFESQVGQTEDAALRAQQPWLRDQLDYLIHPNSAHPPTQTLLNSAGVVASYEGRHGSLSRAIGILARVLAAQERIATANPDNAEAQRDVAVSLNQLGDFLSQRRLPDDAERALQHFQRFLEISEGLLAATPDSAQAQRDVSVALSQVGEFLSQRGLPGDAEQALQHFLRSLQIREDLAAANPDSPQTQRDVAVVSNGLGDVLSERGNAEQALLHYQRGLEISERLAAASPDSALAQRDFAVSLDRFGDFLRDRGLPGDTVQALQHYQRFLEISKRLATANPESAQAQRDVAVSLNKLGDLLSQRGLPGDAELAVRHYQQSLEIRERLATANPDSAQALRDLMVSLERMAARSARQPEGANAALCLQTRAAGIALALWQRNPQSVFFSRTAVSLFLAVQDANDAGQDELAIQHLRACYEVLDELHRGGYSLDAGMVSLHAHLKSKFGSP
jgi:tetratricopeptide (TPR) repeat protein